MRVELGKFARWSIESRLGSNIRVGVLTALTHYTRRLKSGRRPLAPPRFCRDSPAEVDTALELQVGPETRALLERQACEHGVTLNQVLIHAVFTYLVDLDLVEPVEGAGAGDAEPDESQRAGRLGSPE